jgi:hypothetical protein
MTCGRQHNFFWLLRKSSGVNACNDCKFTLPSSPSCPCCCQDACIQLELNDATLLLPTLVKTTKVLEALPKLEHFAAQV